MAGKMLFGNPKLSPEFYLATGVDLVESEQTVVVIARVPSYISGDLATLEPDLITGQLSKGLCIWAVADQNQIVLRPGHSLEGRD